MTFGSWSAGGAIALLLPALASADRAVAIVVEGPGATEAFADLARAVPADTGVVPREEAALALEAAGQRAAFGAALAGSRDRGALVERLRSAANRVGAGGVVAAQVRRLKQHRWELWILVVDAGSGRILADRRVRLGGGKKGLGSRSRATRAEDVERIRDALVPALDELGSNEEPLQPRAEEPLRAAASPRPRPEEPLRQEEEQPAPIVARVEEGAEESPGSGAADGVSRVNGVDGVVERPASRHDSSRPGDELLDLGAGIELGGRHFAYTDPITSNLRPYELSGVPLLSVQGSLFPLRATGITFVKELGLHGSYGRAFALGSEVEGGGRLETSWDRFSWGLRYRHSFGDGLPVLGLGAGLGGLGFHFEGGEGLEGELPDVGYLFRRAGVDARFPGERSSVTLGLSYLDVFSGGEVQDRFPGATADGLEATVGGSYSVSGGLEARLALSYTRFFYVMSPEVGDTHVAGGALDEYVGLQLGAAYVY